MIEIDTCVITHITAHARHAFPNECCGLLIGTQNRITHAIQSDNISAQDHRYTFEIDPAVHLHTQRRLREEGAQRHIVGVYHSHPMGQAIPSQEDAAHAWEPGLLWLVVSVDNTQKTELGVFLFDMEQRMFSSVAYHVHA